MQAFFPFSLHISSIRFKIAWFVFIANREIPYRYFTIDYMYFEYFFLVEFHEIDLLLCVCYNISRNSTKMKTAFIGHRQIFAKDIMERLSNAVRTEIDNGCMAFTMGTHGEFDRLALGACRRLRYDYSNLEIEVVITSLNTIKKGSELDIVLYSDVKTIMYDIEDAYYKRQIILSNRQMIDTCDTLICYVDTTAYRSGAKMALRYAERKGLKIVNLFREEDQPFYGMTREQIQEYSKNLPKKF